MSQKIYLVQIRSGLHPAMIPSGKDSIRAFTRPDLAEEWAAEHYPISFNPFHSASARWVNGKADGRSLILRLRSESDSADMEPQFLTVSVPELEAVVRSLGLTPPSIDDLPLDPFLFSPEAMRHLESLGYDARSIKYEYFHTLWQDWWESSQSVMTNAQKTELWRFLVPQPYDFIVLNLE